MPHNATNIHKSSIRFPNWPTPSQDRNGNAWNKIVVVDNAFFRGKSLTSPPIAGMGSERLWVILNTVLTYSKTSGPHIVSHKLAICLPTMRQALLRSHLAKVLGNQSEFHMHCKDYKTSEDLTPSRCHSLPYYLQIAPHWHSKNRWKCSYTVLSKWMQYRLMDVCMYLCIYVSTYLCIYVSMYVCMSVCLYVCMSVCVCACVCAFIALCKHFNIFQPSAVQHKVDKIW